MSKATDEQRVETARWILERQLGWIASAEVKIAVVVALSVSMLSGLAVVIDLKNAKPFDHVSIPLAVLLLVAAVVMSAMVIFPRTQGPQSSRVFFGPISNLDAETYEKQLKAMNHDDLLADLAAQIHVNAGIAAAKHFWVRWAINATAVGFAFWMIAMAAAAATTSTTSCS